MHQTITVPDHRRQPDTRRQAFLRDVLAGLHARPRQLPCKYFYDARGSQLFDTICQLPEYYLTRTELRIMRERAAEMSLRIGRGACLIEYGSGSSVKTRLLLRQLQLPATYVPVDISADHLRIAARRLASEFPHLTVAPVVADFTAPFELPTNVAVADRVVVYFPGSTIGNFLPDEAGEILRQIAQRVSCGGGLLLGIDLQKDSATIERAYNDSQGVTDQFNLNLLVRLNRELEGTFNVDAFAHRARYNPDQARVEIYLVSRRAQSATVAGERFAFDAGESILTEYSHKYTIDGFAAFARRAGWSLADAWTDPKRLFAVLYLTVD